MDRASDYGSEGCGFDFCWAHHIREVAQLGRALGLGPRGRRFEACLPDHLHIFLFGALAQLGERLPCTQEVSGSIPLGSTIYHFFLSEVYPSLAEGIGLENRQAGNTARGFESLYLLHFHIFISVGPVV